MGLPAALIASWSLAACDDDSAGPAGDDTLTAEEGVALVDGLTAVAGLTAAPMPRPLSSTSRRSSAPWAAPCTELVMTRQPADRHGGGPPGRPVGHRLRRGH